MFSFRCELIIAWLSFLLLSRERLFFGGCGLWLVSLVAAVRLSAARRALCSLALVLAVKRPCARFVLFLAARSGHRAALASLLIGRSQYNICWPRVANKTKCDISIHIYRCRQSELYRPSLQTDADLQHMILDTQSGQHLPQLEYMSCVRKCAIDNITKDLRNTSIDTP